MGWKIPDMPRPWVFSTDSRFSGSSRGPERKMSKRGSPFLLDVFSLPCLKDLQWVLKDNLLWTYPLPLKCRDRDRADQTEPSPYMFVVNLFYGYGMLVVECVTPALYQYVFFSA